MFTLERLPPGSSSEMLFTIFTLLCTIAAFLYLPRLYRKGPLAAFLGGICISFIPVQLIALVAEDRQMWEIGQHSAIFFWGDLLLLPGAAAGLALVRKTWWENNSDGRRPLASNWRWRMFSASAALLVACCYHYTQVWGWEAHTLHAPSKIWHDYFVYPVFTYYLMSQLPYIFQYQWKTKFRKTALAGVMVAALGVAGGWSLGQWYDPRPQNERVSIPLVSPIYNDGHSHSSIVGQKINA